MTQPSARAVHIDTPLTNISVAFLQQEDRFIASRVFPLIRVEKQSDLYYAYDRSFFSRNEMKLRAPNTEAAVVGFGMSTDSYRCDVWAAKLPISAQVGSNQDTAVDLERAATQILSQAALIAREVDWATRYFTSGVWGTNLTGVASTTPGAGQRTHWSNATNGNPIEDIRAARTDMLEATGYMPNTLVISQRVMDVLVDHPDIVDRIKYSGGVGTTNPAIVTSQALAQLFGLDRVLVMSSVQNTAAEGLAMTGAFIGGKHALLCYVPSTPGLMTPSAGYTFNWSGYMGATNAFGASITRREVEIRRSMEIEIEMAYTHKLVAASLGVFFNGIVA